MEDTFTQFVNAKLMVERLRGMGLQLAAEVIGYALKPEKKEEG